MNSYHFEKAVEEVNKENLKKVKNLKKRVKARTSKAKRSRKRRVTVKKQNKVIITFNKWVKFKKSRISRSRAMAITGDSPSVTKKGKKWTKTQKSKKTVTKKAKKSLGCLKLS